MNERPHALRPWGVSRSSGRSIEVIIHKFKVLDNKKGSRKLEYQEINVIEPGRKMDES